MSVPNSKEPRCSRLGRGSTALASLAVVLTLAMAGAGCTRDSEAEGGAARERPALPASPLSARLKTLPQPVVVVTGADPGKVSTDVSRALFATAPVVVVAPAGHRLHTRRGAAQAARLGVPLLLLDPAPPQTALGDAVTTGASGQGEAITAEIARLRPTAVLAIGSTVARGLGDEVDVPVLTEPARLPAVTPAQRDSRLAVLTRCGARNAASCAVASATARAAGAHVIPVEGHDLRADPKAIAALAEHQPRRVLAVGAGFAPADRLAARLAVARTGTQLPGGGQVLFPGRRLVALYGHPGTPSLGVLGEQPLTASIARAKELAASYRSLSSVPVVPTFEIIATVAQRDPGRDGDYSAEAPVGLLRQWVSEAEAAGLYVVLDLQPGRATFLDQARLYADLLRHPNVGLALDPEWRLAPGQRPLEQIGAVDAAEVNSVITWLADLTARHDLPQKLLVLHQFRLSMIRDAQDLDLGRDNIQVLIHMDGQGTPALKDATWQAVKAAAPASMPFGWKNFYDEDDPMLSPAQTMARRPAPLMISYQ
jgi:hypothetical protein